MNFRAANYFLKQILGILVWIAHPSLPNSM
uniref:Uncharacterized protein n=1 Tax=Rhizophora mucronata TaxID=61149 RepID=A0A2P2QLH5_RHIMU